MHMKPQQCCPLNFLCSIWLPSSQRAFMLSGPIQIKVVSFHFWQAANVYPASFARCPWPWCMGRSQVGLLRPDGPFRGATSLSPPPEPFWRPQAMKMKNPKKAIMCDYHQHDIKKKSWIHTVAGAVADVLHNPDIRYITQWKCLCLNQYKMCESSLKHRSFLKHIMVGLGMKWNDSNSSHGMVYASLSMHYTEPLAM